MDLSPGLQGLSPFTLCHLAGFVTLHDLSLSGLAGFVALRAVSPCKAEPRAPRQQKVLTSVEGWPRGVLQSLITKPVIRTCRIFTDDRFCLLTYITFGRVTLVSFLTVLLLQVVAFGLSVIITPPRGVA